ACLFPLVLSQPDLMVLVTQQFGTEVTSLLTTVCKLELLNQKISASYYEHGEQAKQQLEVLRKMLLAFARDMRVVLIRLASTLHTLRACARMHTKPPDRVARRALDVYAPLANRLGVWQVKWELEDLAFRFDQPQTYHEIARFLDEKRIERESFVSDITLRLEQVLKEEKLSAEVSGRPKHIYSIWKKMRGKSLGFVDIYDVRAFRIIVNTVKDCYTVLGIVHHLWQPVPREFDDYISRPKPNGYRSLHTVVLDADERAFEIQIRTREMHQFAEFGVAAHWRYKESGVRGYAGRSLANTEDDEKISWLRQLLAWKDEASSTGIVWEKLKQIETDDHIYVLTPQAHVLALPCGATPVDFAYHLHSELGHRCRGARLDGMIVPLNTPLQNGQTVEIITVKQGGPSRDWLNLELGYMVSARARAKVRAWFNTLDIEEAVARGRGILDKILQREGKTAVNLELLAQSLDVQNLNTLLIALAKEKIKPRQVEQALRGEGDVPSKRTGTDEIVAERGLVDTSLTKSRGTESGVLVVGVDALLTQLAKCCRPLPPDLIMGFVTRGNGVSIHRQLCTTLARLRQRAPERLIDTSWGIFSATYGVDIYIEAIDRAGLLRDCTEILSREKINMTDVRTLVRNQQARLQFSVEVSDGVHLQKLFTALRAIPSVLSVSRK
ncbi:MAG: bifunctional (p)ppGpp synthetase/guanosine-3',5'-bis(diphosphate) 3'-pyrophosphohydrolase, partial [Ottowia sp.]|nr:bifunctional (p)ppGpp synthetase/guanosine-3',5'-bis(diphosphate) 3'-pyrophosphohydrolase [Ottowia sp.]